MRRPYNGSSIDELEALFHAQSGGRSTLEALHHELSHRSTKRAGLLRTMVETALDNASQESRPDLEFDFGDRGADDKAADPQKQPRKQTEHPCRVDPANQRTPQLAPKRQWSQARAEDFPEVSNRPAGILEAWAAIEILSPPSFDRPQALAGGDASKVAKLTDAMLPWERGERSRPNQRLYYQIVLGSVELESAIAALVDRFGDTRVERPSTRGKAVLAAIVVDKSGKLVEDTAIGVSSFGWGLMTALTTDLGRLAGWQEIEPQISSLVVGALAPLEIADDDDEEWRSKPLTMEAIERAYAALVGFLGIPDEWLHPPDFAIRSFVYFKDPSPPDPLLLNSFFLNDLAVARRLVESGNSPRNLSAYLGVSTPQHRTNLLEDHTALEAALRPLVTPYGRWPSKGRNPLALLQQAAVNLAFERTAPEGIIGVNGPPGTGKTTLLRDVLANVVVERATNMSIFVDPDEAFEHSGQKLMVSGSWLHLYRVHHSVRGFEMVVASSNNKAVENVSAEVPGVESIADDAPHLRYFKTMSDALHGNETWGAVAAVLGNASNCAKFKQQFWWDDDCGLSSYLRAATGSVVEIQVEDKETGKTMIRLPRIVENEDPPPSRKEALKRWEAARCRFAEVKKRCQDWVGWLESIRADVNKLPELQAQEQATARAKYQAEALEKSVRQAAEYWHSQVAAIEAELGKLSVLEAQLESLGSIARNASGRKAKAKVELQAHERSKPGAIRKFFLRQSFEGWQNRHALLVAELASGISESEELTARLERLEASSADDLKRLAVLKVDSKVARVNKQGANEQLENAVAELRNAEYHAEQASASLAKSTERLEEARSKYGVTFLDQSFWDDSHHNQHTSTAWFPKAAQLARDELFIAAIQLHKAFIDAAAKPLRHNLGALMNIFLSQSLPTAAKQALLGDLWASLFLVVPLVSTTFASVSRMLGKLPPASLGWLLIDEAGQAVPQAAVGAIIRSKRIVVLGDPIQVEPVVTLPDVLTQSILRRFGVDPDRFGAPLASVQTLADAASPVMAEFPTKHGIRHVGVPLLVHRRCSAPMFDIANNIAYAGKMVSAKSPKHSPILESLGASRWIDVTSGGEDKWSEAEGAIVLEMLQKLRTDDVAPSLYIVTPFVVVADRLRQLVLKSNILNDWVTEEAWVWVHARIGTVHTAQGREAEAVIFVLGAPNPAQSGARGWAGGRPNLLNVAVTRAKEALYVVGNRQLWREAGVFGELDARLSI